MYFGNIVKVRFNVCSILCTFELFRITPPVCVYIIVGKEMLVDRDKIYVFGLSSSVLFKYKSDIPLPKGEIDILFDEKVICKD